MHAQSPQCSGAQLAATDPTATANDIRANFIFEVKEICGVGVGVEEGERGEVFYAKEAAREDQKKSRAWELGGASTCCRRARKPTAAVKKGVRARMCLLLTQAEVREA